MAVVWVKERTEQQRSGYRNGKTTHTRVFLVKCSDVADGPSLALTADGVPGPGSFYNGIPFSGKEAQRVPKSRGYHEVTVEYSGDGEPQEQDDVHPLDRPAEVTFGSDNFTEPYFIDRSSPPKPIVNSAGEAPDQFFERDRGELQINFVRNVEYWDAALMETYGNTLNDETIVIDGSAYPQGTLRMLPPTASRQVETVRISGVPQEVVYYRATFVVKARMQGWNDRLADYGYNELVTKTETVGGTPTLVKRLQPIYDRSAGTLRKPWPLDGQGRKKPNPGDTPAELEFKPYPMMSWAALYF